MRIFPLGCSMLLGVVLLALAVGLGLVSRQLAAQAVALVLLLAAFGPAMFLPLVDVEALDRRPRRLLA
ncbi:hypothetical protein M0638_00335 [Roseomonas sp. NAR14]|uniref:Uncharacterized protein n=1 Tax=Roseomonas acroporae TaxID=2937791 RepID=A0A9X1Y5Y9_9PROT|nr:hypothetical protein [Roseomonas acroporae]MCK8782825.1 hypothetical protein [Roseomonas acroporae]